MDKVSSLMNLWKIQQEAVSLFIQAELDKKSGDFSAANTSYGRYVSSAIKNLEAEISFNRTYPESPNDLTVVARPLVNALLTYSDIQDSLGNTDEANALRDRAQLISSQHLGESGSIETERARASSLLTQGRFNAALLTLMKVRDYLLQQHDQLGHARIALDIADIYQWLGDFERAQDGIDHAERSIRPFVQDKPPSQQDILLGLLNSISAIETGVGDIKEAENTAQLYRASREVLYFQGLIYKGLHEWDQAQDCFQQVLEDYRSLGTGAAIEFQLLSIQVAQKQFAKPLSLLQSMEPKFQHGAYRPKLAALFRLQAQCLDGLGHREEASQKVAQALNDLENFHEPALLWRAQWLSAQIFARQDNMASSLQQYANAFSTIVSLRQAPLGYRLDSTYLQDKVPLFNEAVALSVKARDWKQSLTFIEMVKSRTLQAVMSVPLPVSDIENDPDQKQFDELTRSLDAIEFEGYKNSWTSELKEKRNGLWQERANLLEKIRIADPRWRHLSAPEPINLDLIQGVLQERSQGLLSLYYEPERITAVLLIGNEGYIDTLSVPSGLTEKILTYDNNLQKPEPDFYKYDLSGNEFGMKATDFIPPSLLQKALTCSSLVIIPHHMLHLIPWSTLEYKKKRLFQYLPIGILPSLMLLTDKGTPSSSLQKIAIIGAPDYQNWERIMDLPSAKGEIQDLQTLYSQPHGIVGGQALFGRDATSDAFWNLSAQAQKQDNVTLHLSCHGTLIPQEPMNSGLLLTNSKIDAAQIARSSLPFNEVVLSACSTGWRPMEVGTIPLTGDEILGIPAGFWEAGARTILASIPKAESKAARALTIAYHHHRISCHSPLQAFQQAQKQMLEEKIFLPLWCGFTLYGCQ